MRFPVCRSAVPLLTVALISSSIAAFAAPPDAAASPSVPKGYKLVWSDEFASAVNTPPDPKVWGYDLGDNGWGNQEKENYVNDLEHAHVVADSDATDGKAMQIQATSDGKGKYTSARLRTKGKLQFQYGYIEARIRLPYGQGIWPAFWMIGSNISERGVGWPRCGEVDIMENIGRQEWWGKNRSSLHGPGYSGGNSLHGDFDLPAGSAFKDAYHTFSMLWEKDSIQFYVDGKLFETRTPADIPGKEWAFNHPFFFVANVAVGGGWPGNPDATTVFPQKMLIDYVRVYQKQ
jgi:beta-glucanase (GH16 family)